MDQKISFNREKFLIYLGPVLLLIIMNGLQKKIQKTLKVKKISLELNPNTKPY